MFFLQIFKKKLAKCDSLALQAEKHTKSKELNWRFEFSKFIAAMLVNADSNIAHVCLFTTAVLPHGNVDFNYIC